MPNQHVILIHEEDKAANTQNSAAKTLHVCPHQLKVNPGDSVRWLYNELGQFDCKFQHDSPFGPQYINIMGKNGSSPVFTVTAINGAFAYTVNDGFMVKDPIIIVDPSPNQK